MGYFKLLDRLFPKSPDSLLKRLPYDQATFARMAHVNTIIDDLNDFGKYELEFPMSNTVNITTSKGIIDIKNWGSVVPDPDYSSWEVIVLRNDPILNIANRDDLYLQVTPYYSRHPSYEDFFIPYVLPTGYLDGLNLTVYNASTHGAGTHQGEGPFYIYYEIKYLG